jgi:hypothetical protein
MTEKVDKLVRTMSGQDCFDTVNTKLAQGLEIKSNQIWIGMWIAITSISIKNPDLQKARYPNPPKFLYIRSPRAFPTASKLDTNISLSQTST